MPDVAYDPGVGSTSASHPSPFKRFAATVYDAQAGSRSPVLDGPWWLGITIAAALGVLVFGANPWRWFALPVVAALFWLPLCVRWLVASGRSVKAFRDEYRS